MEKKPLVTVAVITYNSSKYVLETLESAKAQTYENIELIISDDKSTDNTVEICNKWLAKNADRFVRTQVIVPEKNTGQAGNCNRVLDASRGEWVKLIAGDDLLLPNCIADLTCFARDTPNANVIFAKIETFGGTKEIRNNLEKSFNCSFFELPMEKQLKRLVYQGNCIPAAGYIYKRQYIIEKGIRNDERIPFIEDFPKWINMLQHNIKFYFMDKPVAKYRIGEGISTEKQYSDKYYHSLCMVDILYRYPIIAKENGVSVEHIIADKLVNMRRDSYELIDSATYKLGNFLLYPLKWVRKFITN